MSYVDAILKRDSDRIHVVERDNNGNRNYIEYPANYIFYFNDPNGKFQSIYGNSVSRFATKSNKEFRRELKMHSGATTWESDINPIFRCLEENYKGKDAPKLHTAFLD